MSDRLTVLQIGGGRNGVNLYEQVCSNLGFDWRLVETPEFLETQRQMGNAVPANAIAVAQAHVPKAVAAALEQAGAEPFVVVAGFERYVYCVAEVADLLGILPYTLHRFSPLNKLQQRNRLGKLRLQPAWVAAKNYTVDKHVLANLAFPVVVKPVDGAGGLGVYYAEEPKAVFAALDLLKESFNYGGGDFAGAMVEEYIPGPEESIQGVVMNGVVYCLSADTKFVFKEATNAPHGLMQFREAGLVVVGPNSIPDELKQLAITSLDMCGYRAGAFHIDLKAGKLLEIGFRPSGFGVTTLTSLVSGWEVWEASLCAQIGRAYTPLNYTPVPCVGELRLRLPVELEKARQLLDPPHVTLQENRAKTVAVPQAEQRHAGTLATVRVVDDSPQTVTDILQKCIADERLVLQIS